MLPLKWKKNGIFALNLRQCAPGLRGILSIMHERPHYISVSGATLHIRNTFCGSHRGPSGSALSYENKKKQHK